MDTLLENADIVYLPSVSPLDKEIPIAKNLVSCVNLEECLYLKVLSLYSLLMKYIEHLLCHCHFSTVASTWTPGED
jgi:hypothetical protein